MKISKLTFLTFLVTLSTVSASQEDVFLPKEEDVCVFLPNDMVQVDNKSIRDPRHPPTGMLESLSPFCKPSVRIPGRVIEQTSDREYTVGILDRHQEPQCVTRCSQHALPDQTLMIPLTRGTPVQVEVDVESTTATLATRTWCKGTIVKRIFAKIHSGEHQPRHYRCEGYVVEYETPTGTFQWEFYMERNAHFYESGRIRWPAKVEEIIQKAMPGPFRRRLAHRDFPIHLEETREANSRHQAQ